MVKIEPVKSEDLICSSCLQMSFLDFQKELFNVYVVNHSGVQTKTVCKDCLFTFANELNSALLAEFGKEG